MELSKLRESIDFLDENIKKLLEERFDLSRKVAMSKLESGSKVIYRKDRENEILDKLSLGLNAEDSLLIREIYKNIMLNSRKIQYKIVTQKDVDILTDLDVKDETEFRPTSLICQGIEGAYSHIASCKIKHDETIFKESFKEVFDSISGQNYGILPLDNSTQGMVSEVYDLLLCYGFYIVKSIDLPIKHVAMAKIGAKKENIKFVTAHNQALSQCSNYIEKKNLTRINSTNNAVAARSVANSDRVDICCIGDKSNAKRYGLDVIDEDICNSAINTTRFIVIGDKFIVPQTGGKVSVVFSTENSSGTLANVLNIISSYGFSLSKIESRPIINDKWEYLFYIDIEGNIRNKDMQALIFELESELPFIKILGSFDEIL